MAKIYDQQFKLFGDEDDRAMLALFGGIGLRRKVQVERIEREVVLNPLHVDQAYLLRYGRSAALHLFEATVAFRQRALPKLWEYANHLVLKQRLPIHITIVLMSERDANAEVPGVYKRRFGGFGTSMDLRVVRAWRIPGKAAFRPGHHSLLPWVMLLNSTAKQREEAARIIVERNDRTLASRMAILAGLRYGNDQKHLEVLDSMLTKEIAEQSLYTKMIRRESRKQGRTEGRAEGRAEGRVEGVEKGRVDGQRELLRTMLISRFGELPDGIRGKLDMASSSELQSWSVKLLKARTINDIVR